MRFCTALLLASTVLFGGTFAFATPNNSDQIDAASTESRSRNPEQRWLILGRITSIKRMNDGESEDGTTIGPPIWLVELDRIEVVTGPAREYTGPRAIYIAASHVEKGLPDTYFNIIVSDGVARALKWARAFRVACFDESIRDPEYDDIYFQRDGDTVCVGVGRYLGEFVEDARGNTEEPARRDADVR